MVVQLPKTLGGLQYSLKINRNQNNKKRMLYISEENIQLTHTILKWAPYYANPRPGDFFKKPYGQGGGYMDLLGYVIPESK